MQTAAKRVAIGGAAAALLILGQVGMSFLANIEPVTLLCVLYAQYFRRGALPVIYAFALAEGLIYGFGIWWFMYLYAWLVPYALGRLFPMERTPLFWAIATGIFGLLFGALCSIPYFFMLGFSGGIAYFVNGVLFDLLHCAGNFAMALVLYRPLSRVLEHIMKTV